MSERYDSDNARPRRTSSQAMGLRPAMGSVEHEHEHEHEHGHEHEHAWVSLCRRA